MQSNLSPYQRRILIGRGVISLILTILTIILLAVADIGIGVTYKNPLVSDNTSKCSLRSKFNF
jgi:hypothetical protein